MLRTDPVHPVILSAIGLLLVFPEGNYGQDDRIYRMRFFPLPIPFIPDSKAATAGGCMGLFLTTKRCPWSDPLFIRVIRLIRGSGEACFVLKRLFDYDYETETETELRSSLKHRWSSALCRL
jgi:hypothetical protein